jgi:hypothetical protein
MSVYQNILLPLAKDLENRADWHGFHTELQNLVLQELIAAYPPSIPNAEELARQHPYYQTISAIASCEEWCTYIAVLSPRSLEKKDPRKNYSNCTRQALHTAVPDFEQDFIDLHNLFGFLKYDTPQRVAERCMMSYLYKNKPEIRLRIVEGISFSHQPFQIGEAVIKDLLVANAAVQQKFGYSLHKSEIVCFVNRIVYDYLPSDLQKKANKEQLVYTDDFKRYKYV